MAMLGYAVYNCAYCLFGAELNALFLPYAALFVLGVDAARHAGSFGECCGAPGRHA